LIAFVNNLCQWRVIDVPPAPPATRNLALEIARYNCSLPFANQTVTRLHLPTMQSSHFRNHLLVAMPTLVNEFFSKSVIYVYEHSTQSGAVGFTLNKPLSATVGNVMEHLKIKIQDGTVSEQPVFSGGPVGPDQGFVLHDRMTLPETDPELGVTVSTSREILKDIATGKGPEHFVVTLGYAGWESGQLEEEILKNDWLVVPFRASLLFQTPIAQRWAMAAKSIGVDLSKLSDQVGHG